MGRDCQVRLPKNPGLPNAEIPPDHPCGFQMQVNLHDLSRLQVGVSFPSSGLLSFFYCAEFETIGYIDCALIYTKDTVNLQRSQLPATLSKESYSLPFAPQRLALREFLSFPFPDATSGDEFIYPAFKDASDAVTDALDHVEFEVESDTFDTLGGYQQNRGQGVWQTSRDLICIANMSINLWDEGGYWHNWYMHIQNSPQALKAGDLGSVDGYSYP